jgi:hypothetical protein
MRFVLFILLAVAFSLGGAQPYFYNSSSSILGSYDWGSDWWTPYQWYRYAIGWLRLIYTRSLAHPTYLNLICSCSQMGLTSTIDAYIDTVEVEIPRDSWVYHDGSWMNWKSIPSSAHYIGRYVTPPGHTPGIVSFNIESWIQTHPPRHDGSYFIYLDQNEDNYDAVCIQAWLGPQGSADIGIAEFAGPVSFKPEQIKTAIPNPASGSVNINLYLYRPGPLTVRIYNSLGKCVRTLVSGEPCDAGMQKLIWNLCADDGKRVPQGNYFYVAETPNQSMQAKIVVSE